MAVAAVVHHFASPYNDTCTFKIFFFKRSRSEIVWDFPFVVGGWMTGVDSFQWLGLHCLAYGCVEGLDSWKEYTGPCGW